MERRDHENATLAFLTEETTIYPKIDLRERIKIEFYKTYDVMTGIRIAATLGGFFSMMILLVLYKNYCKPSKTLSEEQLNAAVTAAAEEEDRALQAALEATTFYTSLEKPRQSLGNAGQPLLSPRFSSVGGGYSHLTPPLRVAVLQQRGKSLPGSVLRFGSNGRLATSCKQNGKHRRLSREEDFDLDCQPPDYFSYRDHLNVPPGRRVSSVTCSSADSSYLERRCSAFEMGYPGPPNLIPQSRENVLQGKKEGRWDFYYPIDIQVIQPTPEMSPTASERNLHEDRESAYGLQVPGIHDQMHRLSVTSFDIGLAPLASISSLGSCSSQSSSALSKTLNNTSVHPSENPCCHCAEDSLGSDSVFMDDEGEVEEGATDSEFEYDGFDDDYSFCESKERSFSRTEMRTLQFASFDSYDASIIQDSLPGSVSEMEIPEEKRHVQALCRQHSSDLRRHTSLHEGNKIRRKLVKTNSEPKSTRILKQLPPWTEKGRSGYVPKRQISSPGEKKKILEKVSTGNEPAEKSSKLVESESSFKSRTSVSPPNLHSSRDSDNTKFFLSVPDPPQPPPPPPTPNRFSSDKSELLSSNTQTSDALSTTTPIQSPNNDLPLTNTRLNAQEKRSRLQKQKNFVEEVKLPRVTPDKTEESRLADAQEESTSFTATSGAVEILTLPPISLTGSCERLASFTLCGPDDKANVTLPEIEEQHSGSSFSLTLSQDSVFQ